MSSGTSIIPYSVVCPEKVQGLHQQCLGKRGHNKKERKMAFILDIPVVLYRIRKYQQNIKHYLINGFIKMYSYIVSFNDMFRL